MEDSYKTRQAAKWNIPVVPESFIQDSINMAQIVDFGDYEIHRKQANSEFDMGRIAGNVII